MLGQVSLFAIEYCHHRISLFPLDQLSIDWADPWLWAHAPAPQDHAIGPISSVRWNYKKTWNQV
jgi:hypothetical protein